MARNLGWIAIGVLCALLGGGRLARGCPAHGCVAPAPRPRALVSRPRTLANRIAIAPWRLRLDLATSAQWWDERAPLLGAERPVVPVFWASLRRRLRDRVPHATGRGLAVAAVPTIVTGTVDTVPGVGVDGQF